MKVIDAYKKESPIIFNKRFGIVFNGEDNLKPFAIENLTDASPSASQCTWIYESFLSGDGFEISIDQNITDDFFAKKTPDDLLFDIAESLARHQGVFIHVGYNALYEKTSFKVIPYTLCRVGKADSSGYRGKIIVSPKGWGRSVKKEEVKVFDNYNPNPDIIQAQVDRDGGWHNYKGQVYFFKLSDKYIYPKPLLDKVVIYADIEANMAKYYNGLIKRRFEDVDVIRYRKFPSKSKELSFFQSLKKVSGIENTASKLLIEDDWDDERNESGNFKFDKLTSSATPDKFKHIEQTAANHIRRVFKNIPPQLFDYIQGKLGNTSGEDLRKAQSIYNASTKKDRKKIESLFNELFENFHIPINPEQNWKIKEVKLLDDGTTN